MARLNELGPKARAAVLEAAEYFELKPDDILSRSRRREYVRARQRVCETLRRHGWTFRQIAAMFGLHYTSVMYLTNREFREGPHTNEGGAS